MYLKSQSFFEITRDEWWARNRPEQPIVDPWGAKEACRWCVSHLSYGSTGKRPRQVHEFSSSFANIPMRRLQLGQVLHKGVPAWIRAGGHKAECNFRQPSI